MLSQTSVEKLSKTHPEIIVILSLGWMKIKVDVVLTLYSATPLFWYMENVKAEKRQIKSTLTKSIRKT